MKLFALVFSLLTARCLPLAISPDHPIRSRADLLETNPILARAVKAHEKLTKDKWRLLRERGQTVCADPDRDGSHVQLGDGK